MGEEFVENLNFEIYIVKLFWIIYWIFFFEKKKFFDLCNNMERLKILIKKIIVFIIDFIFLVLKN